MINLQIFFADGSDMMIYDAHPRSQAEPVDLPPGAARITVWLGIR